MKSMIACCAVGLMALAGCAPPGPGPDPSWGQRIGRPAGPALTVGHGLGSEFGNYPAQIEGTMLGPSGQDCTVFDWDRPLTQTLALRLRSASCGQNGRMTSTELSRSVIPLSTRPAQSEVVLSPRL